MADSRKAGERKALATISSLKRAMAIPNHPLKTDEFDSSTCRIYVPDEASAILLGELLYRYGNGPREKFYNEHPERFTSRDTVKVVELPEGGFQASMDIYMPTGFAKALEKMIQRHIAADSRFK